MDRPIQTGWMRCGNIWQRRYRGAALSITTCIIGTPMEARVDSRRLGGPLVSTNGTTTVDEAKAWCERWCDLAIDEIERGGRG